MQKINELHQSEEGRLKKRSKKLLQSEEWREIEKKVNFINQKRGGWKRVISSVRRMEVEKKFNFISQKRKG